MGYILIAFLVGYFAGCFYYHYHWENIVDVSRVRKFYKWLEKHRLYE